MAWVGLPLARCRAASAGLAQLEACAFHRWPVSWVCAGGDEGYQAYEARLAGIAGQYERVVLIGGWLCGWLLLLLLMLFVPWKRKGARSWADLFNSSHTGKQMSAVPLPSCPSLGSGGSWRAGWLPAAPADGSTAPACAPAPAPASSHPSVCPSLPLPLQATAWAAPQRCSSPTWPPRFRPSRPRSEKRRGAAQPSRVRPG